MTAGKYILRAQTEPDATVRESSMILLALAINIRLWLFDVQSEADGNGGALRIAVTNRASWDHPLPVSSRCRNQNPKNQFGLDYCSDKKEILQIGPMGLCALFLSAAV
jgi:hypothetical protein